MPTAWHCSIAAFDRSRPGFQFETNVPWIPFLGVNYHVGVDGISMPLGSLRLSAMRAGGDRTFARKVGAMLAKADWAAEPGVTLYLVGGSMRAFARAAMVRMNWPLEDTHGFTLDSAKAAAAWTGRQPVWIAHCADKNI